MKAIFIVTLVAGLVLPLASAQAEEIDTLVRDEMKMVFDSAQADLIKAKQKDEEMKGARERAVAGRRLCRWSPSLRSSRSLSLP